MRRFSLTATGAIGVRLWKQLRKHLFEDTPAGAAAVATAAGALLVASTLEPSLSGVWIRDDGSEVRLFHNGARVRAVFEKVSPELERHGFIVGDTHFVATFSSSQLDGQLSVRTEKTTWGECGEKIEHERQTLVVIHVSDDFDKMQATLRQARIDLDHCIEVAGGENGRIKYVRKQW